MLHAYLQWGGDSVQVPLPVGPWGPGRSAESCCVRAGWGASARPPGDPGKQAVGDKGSILGCRRIRACWFTDKAARTPCERISTPLRTPALLQQCLGQPPLPGPAALTYA